MFHPRGKQNQNTFTVLSVYTLINVIMGNNIPKHDTLTDHIGHSQTNQYVLQGVPVKWRHSWNDHNTSSIFFAAVTEAYDVTA